MKVKLAKSAGFCFGVKRAVDVVYESIKADEPVYTYGDIIHNEEVVKDLQSKGVNVLRSLSELKQGTKGTLIIRSHGISKNEYEEIEKSGINIIDATCPFVKKIHNIVKIQSELGREIIIIGNNKHPEVEGIKGWCDGDSTVIETEEEAMNFNTNPDAKICIVAQTTFNYAKFQELVEIISKKGYDILALNTICNATEERQQEVKELAQESDAMIVIGGKHSSNTQKLYEISKNKCHNTFYIQTLDDLDLERFKSFRSVGITAGASTPNKIIEEVHTNMSEMSFEQLLEEESLVTIHNGKVVNGTVISVKEDEIVLNIGYKADGIITRSEYTDIPNADLTTMVKVGDELQVKVITANDGEGQVLLSYKRLAEEKGSKRLEEAFENKEVLKAKVSSVVDGGLNVVVDGARVFIPASLVSDVYEKDLSKYADQEIEFVISEFVPKRRRIIGNRKQLIVAEKQKKQAELLEKISVGMKIEGTIKNVTDFGAFIDLGGLDGLLHISEMSWGHVDNPKKVFKVGDIVEVLIKDIQANKIALSLKFEDKNPWTTAAEKYAIGNVVTGKVARMTDFGAFIELEPGVDALLHVSQISKEHVEKPADALKIGQEVTAKVVDFNLEDKKISLSIKAMLNAEEDNKAETLEEVATEPATDAVPADAE